MRPEIENLKVWMSGRSTTGYQRALAMREFEQLLSYVTELEQLRKTNVEYSSNCQAEYCTATFAKRVLYAGTGNLVGT